MKHRFTFRLDSDFIGDSPAKGNRQVVVTFDKGDAITYTDLCEEFKYFLLACGYDYLHGPLEFVDMEAEKTMDRLAKPESKKIK